MIKAKKGFCLLVSIILTAWLMLVPVSVLAEDEALSITGFDTMVLQEGYAVAQTDAYVILGTSPMSITITGDAAFTWNIAESKLNIAQGLTAGTYPVTITATNAVSTATHAFELLVVAQGVSVEPRLSIGTAIYNKANPRDITVTLFKDTFTLTRMTQNGAPIGGYSVNGDEFAFAQVFLDTLPEGTQSIIFEMSGGQRLVLNITVKAKPAPLPPPKTGDFFPTEALFAAMLLLLLGVACMANRKTRKAQ